MLPTSRAAPPYRSRSCGLVISRRGRDVVRDSRSWGRHATRRKSPASAQRTSAWSSGDRLNGNVEELDRRTALRSAGTHRVEYLVAAAHGLLALEQRHAEPLAGLAIHEHQHLRALEPFRGLLGLDRRTDHLDRLVDVGRIALERRYARVHQLSLISHQDGFSLRRNAT